MARQEARPVTVPRLHREHRADSLRMAGASIVGACGVLSVEPAVSGCTEGSDRPSPVDGAPDPRDAQEGPAGNVLPSVEPEALRSLPLEVTLPQEGR